MNGRVVFDLRTWMLHRGWPWVLAAVGVSVGLNLAAVDDLAPYGVLSLSSCGDTLQAEAIVQGWKHRDQMLAAFSLGFDMLTAVLYSGWTASACFWAGERHRRAHAALGAWSAAAAGLAAGAGGFDVLENLLTLALLSGLTSPPFPLLAMAALTAKFSCLALALLYAASGLRAGSQVAS